MSCPMLLRSSRVRDFNHSRTGSLPAVVRKNRTSRMGWGVSGSGGEVTRRHSTRNGTVQRCASPPVGSVLDPANPTPPFHALARAAQVPRIRLHDLHDLRYTHASLLAFRGVAPKVIADRLGHTHVGFTMQVYTHLYDEQRREAAPCLAELIQHHKAS